MKKTIASIAILGLSVALATPSNASQIFPNCTALNKVYKSGVGLEGAQNMVKGKPKASKHLVDVAIYEANKKKLDRDKDGIACEK
jgi:hypothetical protein